MASSFLLYKFINLAKATIIYMKTYILLFILAFPIYTFGQVFQDHFNDGNFSANPQWFGDTAIFMVNANQELQLNDTTGGAAQLYAPLAIADSTVWEFYFRLEFAPTTSNQLRIYLSSDGNDFSANLNGYYLEIGETGNNDALRLYRQTGSAKTLLITSTIGAVANDPAKASVRVIRDNNGNWQLFADYAGGTNYTLEGTTTDNTHPTGSFFGFYCKYTSTRKDKFYFDNIHISPLFLDNAPPFIDTILTLNNASVDVYFNELVEQTTAENINNYTVSGIGNPITALRDANDLSLVHLSLGTALTNNQTYTLTISGVKDVNGNTQPNDQQNFTFLEVQMANAADILINEIMADPTPSAGLPEAEFVELYNASTKTIDLSTLTFYNSSTAFSLPTHLMQANDYVILCNATHASLFSSFGATVLGINSFSALTNTGDDLRLENAQNTIIHQVNYEDSWYGDLTKSEGGYTLELINPTLICLEKDNWQASNAIIGGTPGQQNSVFDHTPDLTAPVVQSVLPITNQTLRITFDELVSSNTAQNTANFSLNNGFGNPSNIQIIDNKTIELTFAPVFQNQTTYTIAIENVEDCSGNAMNLQTTNFDYVATEQAQTYDILITEIYTDPTPSLGLPEAEYIELYNRSNKAINLQEVRFSNKSTTIDLPFYILEPNAYVIIYEANLFIDFSNYGAAVAVEDFPALTNTEDELTIKRWDENVIHYIPYTLAWYQDSNKSEGGFSLEMKSLDNFCQSIDNWSASISNIGGTPGQKNSIDQNFQDTESPKLIRAFPTSDTAISLYFNEALSATGWNALSFNIIGGNQQILSAHLKSPAFKVVDLTLDAPLVENTIYTIEVLNDMKDCLGNVLDNNYNSISVALPQTDMATNDIIINEILFNPSVGGADFIELYNHSEKVFNLADIAIANTENGFISSFKNIETDYLLFPQAYVAISTDIQNIKNEYLTSKNNDALLLENDLPTFADDKGGILILNNGISIDALEYADDWHHPLIADKEGVSLERIDFSAPTQQQDNWHSAAGDVGFATPTYENSQLVLPASTIPDEVWLSRATFSPDNDGFEDFLLINYQMNENGFTANIDIFDANGRWIKRVAKNELLGLDGFFRWDGTTEAGEKARMGIYAVFVELIHPSGMVQRIKKTAVLASRI
jgi:hypothetical protein